MNKGKEAYLAKGAGWLFLITMAAAIAANLIVVNLLQGDEYLVTIAANQIRLGSAGFFMVINSLGVIGIAVFFYPILSPIKKPVALFYFASRVFEAAILVVGFVALLTLGVMAEEQAGGTNDLYALAKVAIRTNWYAYNAAMAALGLGSLPFCYLLFQHKLIPNVLSILGLIAYTILFVTSMLAFLGIELGLLITLPGFFFEVSFGIWLIIKGVKTTS